MKKTITVIIIMVMSLNFFPNLLLADSGENIKISDYTPQLYIQTAEYGCESCNSNNDIDTNNRLRSMEIQERLRQRSLSDYSSTPDSVLPEGIADLGLVDWGVIGVVGYMATMLLFSLIDSPEYTRVK